MVFVVVVVAVSLLAEAILGVDVGGWVFVVALVLLVLWKTGVGEGGSFGGGWPDFFGGDGDGGGDGGGD